MLHFIENSQFQVWTLAVIGITFAFLSIIGFWLWGRVLRSSFSKKTGICEVERRGILGKHRIIFELQSISVLQIKEIKIKNRSCYRLRFYFITSDIIYLPGYYGSKRAANRDAIIISEFLEITINYLFRNDSLWR